MQHVVRVRVPFRIHKAGGQKLTLVPKGVANEAMTKAFDLTFAVAQGAGEQRIGIAE